MENEFTGFNCFMEESSEGIYWHDFAAGKGKCIG